MEGHFKNFDQKLAIFNCYGPYKDDHLFWNSLEASRLLGVSNLIVVENINFTISLA